MIQISKHLVVMYDTFGTRLLLMMVLFVGHVECGMLVPTEMGQCFFKRGDIYLGLLFNLREQGEPGECGDALYSLSRPQRMEGFDFVINEINQRDDILPNITLGYVAYDTCYGDLTTLGQSLHLAPATDGQLNGGCSGDDNFDHHQVVGVVGYFNSRQGIMASSLLSLFKIPVIGAVASSDDLSDKTRFGYFLRLVPPDSIQAQAIIDILIHYNWTYASLLYSTGSYGENGAKMVEQKGKNNGICFPVSVRIPSNPSATDFRIIFATLLKNANARVVILFVSRTIGRALFEYANFQNIQHDFIWVGSDDISDQNFGQSANGMLTLEFSYGSAPLFAEHYLDLTPLTSTNRPWMRLYWEKVHGCSWDDMFGNGTCSSYANATFKDQSVSGGFTKLMDAVYAFALGADELLNATCPGSHNQSTLNNCIKGNTLLEYVKKVEFQGRSGNIKFNTEGALIGQYDIKQYIYNREGETEIVVGTWDQEAVDIHLEEQLLDWSSIRNKTSDNMYLSVPSSVCSLPCVDKEYAVQMELPCCWVCRSCRANEFLKGNNSGCKECLENTWPDDNTATFCEDIPPDYMQWSDLVVIALAGLAFVGLALSFMTLGLYIKHRREKLIKASSRELSALILIGVIIALFTILVFLVKPSDTTCMIRIILFNVSVSFIYVPLLVKTNRVYRIFAAGKTGVKQVKYINTTTQMIISSTLIGIQVCVLKIC